MKKKIKKAQMGLFASSNKLPIKNELPLITEPVFKTKAEFDKYHLEKSIEKLSPEDKQWYNDALSGKVKNVTPNDIIALRAPTPYHAEFNLKGKREPMGNVLGRAYGLAHGGIIEDNAGQLKHPGKITKINSPSITMKGVKKPLLGVSNTGDTKLMHPGKDYLFNGDNVTEFPLAQDGANLGPKKFLFEKKKKMNTFDQFVNMNVLTKGHPEYLPKGVPSGATLMGYKKKAQVGINVDPIETNWGSENIFTPGQFSVQGQAQQFSNTLPQQDGFLEELGGTQGVLNTASNLFGGFQMAKQDKENRQEAKQFYKLSKLINKASALPLDKPKRKYVRPEDQVIDPETLANSYGTGTNYLKHGGEIDYQFGGIAPFFQELGTGRAGNIGQMLGSAIGGGGGTPSGAGVIGSTIGGLAGPIGGFIGGAIGGLIGGKTQRETARYQRRGQHQLEKAAFQQGSQQIHNQYTGFMQNGGVMNGELQVYDNGYAEPVSQNPYLPNGGESIMFKGASHENGGIPISFGKTPVEVEGGEPAVKLENGLTVFGDMNIPAYGALELNDPKAKGKKFKSYVNNLNKKENKQNEITDTSIMNINDNPMATSFDKLELSSNEAMLIGANMNLKDIANKKQIASNVQKAILDTAEEFNLDSSELAKGNIKKMRKGKRTAQRGGEFPSRVSREDIEELQRLEDLGFKPVENDPNRLFRTLTSEGRTETTTQNKGGVEYNKWFKENYSKNKGKVLQSKWGPQLMELGQRTNKISYPGSSNTDYVDIYDVNKRPLPGLAQINPIDVSGLKVQGQIPQNTPQQGQRRGNFDWMNAANSVLPYLRPTNQLPLDSGQLSGEMFSLATNQLEPVQAQLYNPLLEQVSDISLQDQLNSNQSDFNSLQRSLAGNPAALAALAGQKYQANTGVLGEQFRLNQGQRQGTYNRNRATLNDAQLKNLGILDQQYVRQSEAKSKTKAVAQSALQSIGDKIQRNKLENRTLGIYENLYNYRFLPKGQAFNLNPLFTPNIPQVGEDLPLYDENGTMTVEEYRQKYDKIGNPTGSEKRQRTTKKNQNGGIVKALKSSNIKGY